MLAQRALDLLRGPRVPQRGPEVERGLAALDGRSGFELSGETISASRGFKPVLRVWAEVLSRPEPDLAICGMGLRDVAALAEAVADAARLGLDIGGADVLERYQRWRRFDTMTMGVATDSLNRLFSNSSDVLRLVRDLGLGVVERLPALKRVFIREAAGFTGDVPKLLRGEAL